MTARQVTNTEVAPGGTAIADALVTVELVTTTDGSVAPGYEAVADEAFIHVGSTTTDASGVWTVALEPNTNITPAGNIYKVTVRPPAGRIFTYEIVVPDSVGPHWVGDILNDPPASLETNHSLLEATAHGGIVTLDDTQTVTGDKTYSGAVTHTGTFRVTGTPLLGATGTVGTYHGTGDPEGAVTAPVGSLFVRTDGGAFTTLYVKESGVGNTGWVVSDLDLPSLANTWSQTQTFAGADVDTLRVSAGPWVDATHPDFGAVGDGVADDTAAFTAALAAGDQVLVPTGLTFLISDVSVGDDKTIFGGGTIKKAAAAESGLHLTGDNVTVTGLVFEAAAVSGQPNTDIKLGDGIENPRIEGCTFKSGIYSAIAAAVDSDVGGSAYATRVNGVQIVDNRFLSPTGAAAGGYTHPIYLHSVDNITIADNTIRDTNFDAIRLRENDGFCTITGNLFINIGDPAWPDLQTRDAIDVFWSGRRLTVSNNIIRTTAFQGLDLKGASPTGDPSQRIIVTGNQISGTRFSPILVGGHPDYDGGGSHAFVDNIIIANNILEDGNQEHASGGGSVADAAIRLKGLVKYATIADNHIVGHLGRGIYVHNNESGKEACRNIEIGGNTCINNGHSSDTTAAGIMVSGSSWVNIHHNICESDSGLPNNNQTHGIFVSSATDGFGYTPVAKSIKIDDNICRNNATTQILCDANNTRADAIASFSRNLQSAVHRASWQNERGLFHGQSAPAAGDGTFRRGDIILSTIPTAGGKAGWICVADGNPGTWKQFGAIDA